MKRIIATIFLFAVSADHCISQNSVEERVSRLYHYKGNVALISWDGQKYLEPEGQPFNTLPQCLVRNTHGLYLALNGSGRLYKAGKQGTRIIFQRIDSTIYSGDNFQSCIFSFRDTIYSLGGYGFWRSKGPLRYYVEQRQEWEVVRLNREVPIQTGEKNDLLWYDQQNGKICFTIIKEINSTTTEPTGKFLNTVWTLDLSKKEWTQLGVLTPYLKDNLINITNIISSPFGQLVTLNNQNLFLDYARNRIYRLSDAKQRQLELLPTTNGEAHVDYFIDSTFYSWLTSRGLVDSLKISRRDLVLINEKIYSESQSISREQAIIPQGNFPWFLVISFGIIGAFVSRFYFRNSRRANLYNRNETGLRNNQNAMIAFNTLETDIVRCVYHNSAKGDYTPIEEINTTLGVAKKSPEVQKKQRSDVIVSINKKYSYISRGDQELIEKRRTEFDKRSFEYFIDASRLNDAALIMKQNGLENGT